MAAIRSKMAGGVDWKAAIIVLLIGFLFRSQIIAASLWVTSGSQPAITQPLETTPFRAPLPQVLKSSPAPMPVMSAVRTMPATPVTTSMPLQPAPPAVPMPVVITPTLEHTRNVATARREGGGHFSFAAEVNGVALSMVFDTGASYVTLSTTDAARAGIDIGSLAYSVTGKTANGSAEFAPVTIATLTVGTITRRNVAAMVARPGKLDVDLLGQTFLARIASVNVEGNELTLRGGDQ